MSDTSVRIVENSPRDGLQYLKGVTTQQKINFINHLSETGIKAIDCVSFIHPALFPQYADAEEVISGIKSKPGVIYSGMVPNEMGCRRALATKIDEISFLLSTNDDFSLSQKLKPLRETLNNLPTLCQMSALSGKQIRAHITTFEYPGDMNLSDELLQLIIKLNHLGVKEISLMDFSSGANPVKVKKAVKSILDLNLSTELAVHFHNNRNAAMANCVAAYEAGVRVFDTALAGLSSPHSGSVHADYIYMNLPTEDLVYLFESIGIPTGIDMDALMRCVELTHNRFTTPHRGRRGKSKVVAKKAPQAPSQRVHR